MTTQATDNDAACAGECPLGQAMQRRAFMERTALAALGAMLAGCGDGIFGPEPITATILPGTNFAIRIADYPALAAVGGVAVTSVGGVPVAIGRTGSTTFNIYSLVCPHQSNAVSPSGSGFLCAGHNATWNASGTWTGGQSTGNLTVYPSVFDPATGLLTLNGGAPPAFEQDFTIDLSTVPALAPVGGYTSVTRPIPNTTATTRIYIVHSATLGYIAYGAACGHQGKYLAYNTTLRHWRCPEHHAEYDMDGQKLRTADDNTNIPTSASLVMMKVTQTGNTLQIQGNSPPEGTNF